MAVEPVMPIAEPFDAVARCDRGLSRSGLGQSEIVIAKVGRKVGLVMSIEQWPRRYHVGPLGKPAAPPLVVFGDRMELGQVEGQGADVPITHARTPSIRVSGARMLSSRPRSPQESTARRVASR